MTVTIPHPAKYSDTFLPIFAELLCGCDRVLDPFGGVGKLAYIRDYGFRGEVWVNDLEPEWISQAPWWAHVTVADAERLPFLDGYFNAICTSPTYSNRLADHHDAKDASRRNGYKFALGRDLTPGNTGEMQWGQPYRDKHERIWWECKRVLADGGMFILNISDHIRKGEIVPVTQWHIDTLTSSGFVLEEHRKVPTPRLRYGANAQARVEYESIVVLRKGA